MTSTIIYRGRMGIVRRTMFGYVTETHPRLDLVQNAISAVCGIVAGAASVAIAILMLIALIMRNVFDAPLGWSVGLTEMYLLPLAAFFGIVTAYRSGAHIAVITLVSKFPLATRKGLLIFSHVLVFAGFIGMGWGGSSAAIFAFERHQGPLPGSALLLIPDWVMYSIMPTAAFLGAVVVAIDIYREIMAGWTEVSTDYEGEETPPAREKITPPESQTEADTTLVGSSHGSSTGEK